MPGIFYVTGLVVPSNTGRSFRIFVLDANGKRTFIGFVSRSAMSTLLQNRIPQVDICKYTSDPAVQEPVTLDPDPKLAAVPIADTCPKIERCANYKAGKCVEECSDFTEKQTASLVY